MKRFAALLLVAGCVTSRPLTDAERAIRVERGGNEKTVELRERCRPGAAIPNVSDERAARRIAIEHGANVAQVIHTAKSTSNDGVIRTSSSSFLVRLWSCPEG